jgi:hypothetical protein
MAASALSLVGPASTIAEASRVLPFVSVLTPQSTCGLRLGERALAAVHHAERLRAEGVLYASKGDGDRVSCAKAD